MNGIVIRRVVVIAAIAGMLLSAGSVSVAVSRVGAGILSGASPFKESARHMAVSAGLADFGKRTLGPYSEVATRIADALYEAVLPSSRSGTLHWPLLALMLAIGLALFVIRAGRGARGADGRERKVGLAQYLLPREIYTHPSARVDIGLYLLDRALLPLWLALGVGLIAPYVERCTILAARDLFGPSPALTMTLGWRLIYGFVTLLVADMIFISYTCSGIARKSGGHFTRYTIRRRCLPRSHGTVSTSSRAFCMARALLQAWVFVAEHLPTSFAGRSPQSP